MLNPTCFAKPCQTLTIKILSTLFLLMISGWVNAQVAKSTQDLIKELESASATCTGACRTTCSDSATLLADWGTVSGHEQEAKNAFKKCYTAFSSDSSILGNPNTMQQMVNLSLASGHINNIARQERLSSTSTARPAGSGFPTLPDLNTYTADGYLDISKVISVLEQLPDYCAPLDGMVKTTCLQSCGKKAQRLQQAYASYQQDKDKARDVKGELRNLMGCEGFFANFSSKNDTFPKLRQFLQEVQNDGAKKWPEPQPFKLEIDDLTPSPQHTAQDIVAQLTDVKAVEKLTFEQAKALLKTHPDYAHLEQRVNQSEYSLGQLQAFFAKLQQQQDAYSKANKLQEWKEKARQVAPLGAAIELHAAANEQCSLDYLQKYQQQTPWMGYRAFPIDRVYDQVVQDKQQLQFQLSPSFLHRLCFEQLTPELTRQFANIDDPGALADKIKPYLAQAPITSNNAMFDRGPSRMMKQSQWTPAWSTFVEQKAQLTKQAQDDAYKEQQRLLAEQRQSEAEQRQQQLLRDQQASYDQASQVYFEAANKQYPAMLAEGVTGYGTLSEIVKRDDRALDFPSLLTSIRQIESELSTSAANLPRQDLVAQLGQIAARPGTDESAYFTNIRIRGGATLANLTQCRVAIPLLTRLLKGPSNLNGKEFLYLVQMTNSCLHADMQQAASSKLSAVMALQRYKTALEMKIRAISPAFNPMRYFQQHDSKKAADLAQTLWGISAEQGLALYQQQQNEQAQQRQSAQGRSLPTRPYKFDQDERLVIMAHIEQHQWRCPRLTGQRGENLPWSAFNAALNKCANASRDEAFRSFTKGYLADYRQNNQ